ncbi:histone deacetylase hos1 [Dimargaris xerosporica]|nr:histone deacetylase hos1 [Dimargaris xerosporica]
MAHRVAYIYSQDYARVADQLPANRHRSSMVHALVEAFGLWQHPRVDVLPPPMATPAELARFHDPKYVAKLLQPPPSEHDPLGNDFLSEASASANDHSDAAHLDEPDCESESESESDDPEAASGSAADRALRLMERYGLVDDCPVFPELPVYSRLVAGGSLMAALCLLRGSHRYAIHWDGGRHHARRAQASGFCYVNDIVLAILALRRKFDRVLYVDMDVHHGDGVEAAFQFSEKVYTLSFHRYDRGFYPGTGSCEFVGKGRGKHFALNVPLRQGLCDQTFTALFGRVLSQTVQAFSPDCIVLQCGCDGLAQDPTKEWNLTPRGLGAAVTAAMSHSLPVLFLGGGGYNHPNAARCNVYLTSLIVEPGKLAHDTDIPEHHYYAQYSPTFNLQVPAGAMPDGNSAHYVEELIAMTAQRIQALKS